ncbi:metallophosphoesterase [Arthrobacter zhaoguopingii]|uniref:metallophosphoesterase n=1 Tax=Arthrobacter zhaoguopingii TaxID=2681491 RepID=UPI0013581F6C|nr:metallophosphoesterase [Arthrobacter zhaoguopingii]
MKRLLKSAAAGVMVILGLLIAYGTFIEPRLILDEQHHNVSLPGLTAEWEGTEVAIIADLQVGMWFANTAMVERIVDRVVEEDPAALLIAGDFLYSEDPENPEKIETVLDLLDPIQDARIPVFAVLGNHDYAVGAADQLTDALESRGVTVLLNAAAPLEGAGNGGTDRALHIVGIGPAYQGLADVERALGAVPEAEPRIVMMHNPATFPALPAGSAPFAVAGHTHCGQIAVPGMPQWSWLAWTTQETMVADGFAPEEYGAKGNALFVTCGIGFSNLPMRISAPPQLVFLSLQAADPA